MTDPVTVRDALENEPVSEKYGGPPDLLCALNWATERKENTARIMSEKTGQDRDGWLMDWRHWDGVVHHLRAALAQDSVALSKERLAEIRSDAENEFGDNPDFVASYRTLANHILTLLDVVEGTSPATEGDVTATGDTHLDGPVSARGGHTGVTATEAANPLPLTWCIIEDLLDCLESPSEKGTNSTKALAHRWLAENKPVKEVDAGELCKEPLLC